MLADAFNYPFPDLLSMFHKIHKRIPPMASDVHSHSVNLSTVLSGFAGENKDVLFSFLLFDFNKKISSEKESALTFIYYVASVLLRFSPFFSSSEFARSQF